MLVGLWARRRRIGILASSFSTGSDVLTNGGVVKMRKVSVSLQLLCVDAFRGAWLPCLHFARLLRLEEDSRFGRQW